MNGEPPHEEYLSVSIKNRTDPWYIVVALVAIAAATVLGGIYLYAFLLPNWIGFEPTVLIGIALLLIRAWFVTSD